MPPQRKRPGMDHTREALRRHDEQMGEPEEEAEEPAPAEQDEEEPEERDG